MKSILKISNLRTLSFFLALFLAIPLSWKGLTGFYSWFSPFMMLNSVLTLKSFVWLNLVACPILIFGLFRKRWFCTYLCPLGWSCDLVSGFNTRRSFSYKRLPDFNKWLAVISLASAIVGIPIFIVMDPLAIFNGFFTIFTGRLRIPGMVFLSVYPLLLLTHVILPGIWCTKFCPLGGLQLLIFDIKTHLDRLFSKKVHESLNSYQGRRYFLMTGIGLFAGLTVPRILKPPAENIIRPPASVDPALFNILCCRCGNCNKACPTGIIVPETDFNNLARWMTPKISFKSGYCLETCNMCSRVCPSGSITLFDIKAKGQLFIGTAKVQLENCLLVKNKECVRCKESCKYDAIDIVAGNNIFNVTPVVNREKCVGCGACKVVCPTNCIEIIQLQ
jgi:formate hydrogenlyase subunit 6/NADH:ubiquinone oxidoreductase subunit I